MRTRPFGAEDASARPAMFDSLVRTSFRLFLISLFAAACASDPEPAIDAGPPPRDASSANDATVHDADASDAGVPAIDAGDAGLPANDAGVAPLLELDAHAAELLYVIGTSATPAAQVNVRSRGTVSSTVAYYGAPRGSWLNVQSGAPQGDRAPYTFTMTDSTLIEGVYGARVTFTAVDGAERQSAIFELLLIVSPTVTEPEIAPFGPDKIISGVDEVIYLFSRTEEKVYRRSLLASRWLTPISISSRSWNMAYSANTHHLYFSTGTGDIRQIDLNTGIAEEMFASLPMPATALATAGPIVFVAEPSSNGGTHRTFLPDGTPVSVEASGPSTLTFEWSSALHRMFYFTAEASPTLQYKEIDEGTGELTHTGSAPQGPEVFFVPPIRPSSDGRYLMIGGGDLYDGTTLESVGAVPVWPADAAWLPDDTLLTIRAQDGGTVLEHWAKIGRLFERINMQLFAGTPAALIAKADSTYVVTLDNGVVFSAYVPNQDGDGDGMLFANDVFPLDPAASIDTDGDRAPDAWSLGKTEADTTTGLQLDAFPSDSACQHPEHALENDPATCDRASTAPAFAADRVFLGANDELYLFIKNDPRIHRWSLANNVYLDPWVAKDSSPIDLAYSTAHRKIYIYGETGAITELDPQTGAQTAFDNLPGAPSELVAVGPLLFAVDNPGMAREHLYFPDGTKADMQISIAPSWGYVYDEYGRIYSLCDLTFYIDLCLVGIDPGTGVFVGAGHSLYGGEYTFVPPIRPSADGSYVLVAGSGEIFEGETLLFETALSISVRDAAWLPSGALLTIREQGSSTLIEMWMDRGAGYLENGGSESRSGAPVRILTNGPNAVVVTLRDKLDISTFIPF